MASIETLKALHEKRATLHAQLKAHADTQDKWTAEDSTKWDELNAAYDENYTALEKEQADLKADADRKASVETRLAAIDNHGGDGWMSRLGRDGGSVEKGPVNRDHFEAKSANRDKARALAIQGWLRAAHDPSDVGPVTDEHRQAAAQCGISLNAMAPLKINLHSNFSEVRNALSAQDGSTGGFTFHDTFVANLERAMLAFGGMFQVSSVIRTSTGEPMRWPTANDTANTGRQLGENAVVTSTAQPSFAQVIWNAYKFTSDEILVPFELLRDNAVNLAEVLSDMLGERLGRIQNTKYTTGTGAGTPYGIVTVAAAGVTTASSSAIAFDEVIDLEHSLDPSRRSLAGVQYMFHDSILKALRKLKDGNGQYLWQSGANSGAPDTLNRYPYTINQDMASSLVTTAVSMIFGQMTQYKIRQVNSVRMYRLVERHRENDQDAFLAFVEGDGNLLNAGDNPVKKMTQV